MKYNIMYYKNPLYKCIKRRPVDLEVVKMINELMTEWTGEVIPVNDFDAVIHPPKLADVCDTVLDGTKDTLFIYTNTELQPRIKEAISIIKNIRELSEENYYVLLEAIDE